MSRYFNASRFLYDLLSLHRNVRTEHSKLAEIQTKKMRTTIRYAYENVPFYHSLLRQQNLKPTEIMSKDDLRKIPIVTRKDAQNNSPSLMSRKINPEKCTRHRTSGSSGIPLTVWIDKDAAWFRHAVSLRQFFECGGKLRDKQAQLRGIGSLYAPGASKRTLNECLPFFRTKRIVLAHTSDYLISSLKEYKPDVMVGYPSLFQLLAENAREAVKPRIVFCTGEILTNHCRALLRSAFNSDPIDSYGCTEVGDIAWECPDNRAGYHINADSLIVEFVRDGENVAPGEEGEIVLTTLCNRSMPFIRYNTGDVGVPSDEQCSCGRTLPLMRLIKGRSDDFIVLPNGTRLSPLGILNMENFPEVEEYRIIQQKRDLVEVWLKMEKFYQQSSVAKCLSALRNVFGEDVQVRPLIVDQIPRDDSGKLRRIVSKIAS